MESVVNALIRALVEARIPRIIAMAGRSDPVIGPGRALYSNPALKWVDTGEMYRTKRAFTPTSHTQFFVNDRGELMRRWGDSAWDRYRGTGAVAIQHAEKNQPASATIENPHDPVVAKTLKALLSVDPSIGGYPVRTSGGTHHGSIASLARKLNASDSGPYGKKPIVLYHGTTSSLHPRISKYGLRPRGTTGIAPTWGGEDAPSKEHLVYLGTRRDAEAAAGEAAQTHGGDPAIYRVVVHDRSKLEPDEDWLAHVTASNKQERYTHTLDRVNPANTEWWHSLRGVGSVGYNGRIPASHIERIR